MHANRKNVDARTPSPAPGAGAGTLFQRLLDTLALRARPQLPPAGQRSGAGSESLEPFLREARSTRPGALE